MISWGLADDFVAVTKPDPVRRAPVKSRLSELVGRVHDHHERVTVTVHSRPSAVLIALEDLEQLEETLAILGDADTLRRLASSDAELAQGESVSAGELAEIIRRRSAV
jgi:antitoxin YefM